MTRYTWAAPVLALLTLTAAAAPARCERTLSVNVTGISSAMPDLLFVYLRAVARDTEIAAAQQQHDEILAKVREGLAKAKVAEEDISAAGFSVDPIATNYGSGRDYRIVGYEVSTAVTVVLAFDADKPETARQRALEIMAAAAAAGGEAGVPSGYGNDRFECIRYGVRDPEPHQRQALDRGLAEIQPKAEQIARQLGLTLMGIQNVNYSFDIRQAEGRSVSIMAQRAFVSSGSSRDSAPQPIEYRAQVNATYLVE